MYKKRHARRRKLVIHAFQRRAASAWHWYSTHFSREPLHPFAHQMLEAILDCDQCIAGFGEDFLDVVFAINDKEKCQDHYDQLLQRMAELLVISQSLRIECKNPKYLIEPTAGDSKKRPDLLIQADDLTIGIEVKAPAFHKLRELRKANTVQVVGRQAEGAKQLEQLFNTEIVLPRDNSVKDFLNSADEKFSGFKSQGECLTLLVVVWDDFPHEIITALTNERSGLLTPNSFAKDKEGRPLTYPNIDGIIVLRHLMYFALDAGDQLLPDRLHGFDFGDETALPNIYIPNPISGKMVPDQIREVFRAYTLDDESICHFADYRSKDFVMWLGA